MKYGNKNYSGCLTKSVKECSMIKLITPNTETIKNLASRASKKYTSRDIVKRLANPNSYLPVILLEGFVEAGRTFQAYKRGGFDEARERITEEFSGALFWLGGIPAFNWIFNKVGKKFLSLPDTKDKRFSLEKDKVRKPLDNFIDMMKKQGSKITENKIAGFKLAQAIAGVIVVNAFIGFIVPKCNQAITRWYHRNKPQETSQDNVTQDNVTPNDKNQSTNDGKVSFGSAQSLLTLANFCENNRNFKLLSIDAGTLAGRTYSARNNDERAEIAIRDASSIFFYTFNMGLMYKGLNWLQQHNDKPKGYRTSRLDSVSGKYTADYINQVLENNKNMTLQDMEKGLLGDKNAKVPDNISALIKEDTANLADIEKALKASGREDLIDVARAMSELQPKVKGVGILTKGQINDLFRGGAINNPQYLKELYNIALGDDVFAPFKFISQSSIDKVKKNAELYVESMINKAKKEGINELTSDIVKRVEKSNKRCNALNIISGFGVSALFLSTIIPKAQYAYTKWRTGSDGFPGTKDIDKNTNENTSERV